MAQDREELLIPRAAIEHIARLDVSLASAIEVRGWAMQLLAAAPTPPAQGDVRERVDELRRLLETGWYVPGETHPIISTGANDWIKRVQSLGRVRSADRTERSFSSAQRPSESPMPDLSKAAGVIERVRKLADSRLAGVRQDAAHRVRGTGFKRSVQEIEAEAVKFAAVGNIPLDDLIAVLDLAERGLLLPEGFVAVPREPTEAMTMAGVDAAWPGPDIVFADEHPSPEVMIDSAYRAMIQAQEKQG